MIQKRHIFAIFLFLLAIGTTFQQVPRIMVSASEPLTSPISAPITPSISPTPTQIPPATNPATPSPTVTVTPMQTPTSTPTKTPSPTVTPTNSPTSTLTPTETPIQTSTPTQTPNPTTIPTASDNNGTSGSSGSSGGSGSSGSAPSCTDQKPSTAPRIISIRRSGTNQITIVWAKAADPVSYYLVAYGTRPGSLEYGSGAIGNKDTTSFQINGLSAGKNYYFRVRAGNGCKPGDYSPEVGARTTGAIISGPAIGFQPGVLGTATKKKPTLTAPQPTVVPQVMPLAGGNTQSSSWLKQVGSFFSSFFSK